MLYPLYIAAIYLLVTTVILLRNRKDFHPLKAAGQKYFEGDAPLVSLCIPARNEEGNIERCVRSAMNQSYPNLEVIVLDDHSSDRTPEILFRLANKSENSIHIIQGKTKPDNWLGKPWACQQLAEEAEGDILIFIDA
ncbi:MAG: glycosyltransferase family 2 protein, partial [Balneolaceae bacterium]|nr:glycosyltransferase family 2 protein [Balneolaceae bacterium]